ncbi:FAD-binding protein [Bradyrhizobium sp. U87765 SZCCT0131]|uniref:FAD-dependent oxidoreductase n=1 Tax=unclassified Bradyrhizobium TaxID=2631580 RepID=UPI001BA60DDD|nr:MULTISPECIES: FAD-binding protein [unclassified Bradyrhizobium]MBR1223000.1 FAD-binding protein [Bradyrhizobium sp. U87765 SZCCT0131]MBR1262736.1 FAD-binding protein [Bradyrhizobium sp. U87765 SZCCT0134]MBR1308792.1 FAD-binding protein [Bradyrhizobium sp. U87765 SZCCT0110]MBR1318518.1 FAD-binding protein [Bradyrhizobium sp. U87765 SZCCT0109]MBR1352222.1 FAD-binding protein [Bradyrhizobium sp. U87765 SZCCT0048]
MVRSAPEPLALQTDVLVIGGGMAGAWAATAAAKAGATVTLVDKGYCGTSGVTATAGPGHWWVPPDPPEARAAAVRARVAAGLGLGEADWMHRILDRTWCALPTLAPHYRFGVDDSGRTNYRAVRGPEYMRALRRSVLSCGVTILDHSPAQELLARDDGSIGGAQGLRRQDGGRAYRIEAGAVVLAAGGTSFLSHLLGSWTNTGDGYLMAAEAGAELSGMEFTGAYTIAPAHSTMTRSMAYAFATYYDADGHELDIPFAPDQTLRLARALLRGRVYCSLHRLPDDIRLRLHMISPNVPLVFDRWQVDPYRDRFEVTLHNDGTIRGLGGVRVAGEDCATSVPGLFVAGDNASREKVAGAISGGGNVNSAWALSSGMFAGEAAARLARGIRARSVPLRPLGRAGLRPQGAAKTIDLAAIRDAVRGEMHPFDKNLFRSASGLVRSRDVLDNLWRELAGHASGQMAVREAAALVATARWSVATAIRRTESRGLHRREDHPALDPALAVRLLSSGFDRIQVTADDAAAVPASQHALEGVP